MSAQGLSKQGLFNLLIVYTVWSSTYLAMRVLVSGEQGIYPLTGSYLRLLCAGTILAVISLLNRHSLRVTRQQFMSLTISGLLLWGGGNGLIMWGETTANSGFAALIASSSPLVVAAIEALLERKLPSRQLIVSLLLAFAGLGVLLSPSLRQGAGTGFWGTLALVAGAVSWGCGTVYQSRRDLKLPATVVAAYQHLMAGLFFLLLALANGAATPNCGASQWLALSYLILFGSVISFTAFIKAVQLLPIHVTMTYAFVNPVLAIILGWALLQETVGYHTLAGAFLVIMGVVGVFLTRLKAPRSTLPQPERAAA